MLAAIYLASGEGHRGLTLLKQASQLDPGDFRPWYAMGKVYHDLGDLPRAADAYGKALERSPPPAEARFSNPLTRRLSMLTVRTTNAIQARMMTAFVRCTQYEWLFWDGAYQRRGWPAG